MKFKKIFYIFALISTINCFSAQNQGLIKYLNEHDIIGIIVKEGHMSRILFPTSKGCEFYGKCQWCALQSSGQYEGWYECQGQKGAKIGPMAAKKQTQSIKPLITQKQTSSQPMKRTKYPAK